MFKALVIECLVCFATVLARDILPHGFFNVAQIRFWRRCQLPPPRVTQVTLVYILFQLQ